MSTIRRAQRDTPYVQIDNRPLRDARLTWKARGLLAYLLSLPDDWRISRDHLAKQGPDGVAAVRSALTELEAAGYLQRRRYRTDDGKFAWEHLLHETPLAEQQPVVGFPPVDEPPVDNQPSKEVPRDESPKTNVDRSAAPHSPDELTANQRAKRICDHVWQHRKPQPAMPFPAALKAVARLLDAGHSDVRVQAAAMSAPTITVGALEFLLNRSGQQARGAPPIATDRQAESGVVSAEELERWANG